MFDDERIDRPSEDKAIGVGSFCWDRDKDGHMEKEEVV